MNIPAMFRSLPRHTLRLSILSLLCVIGLSYAGGQLATNLIANQVAEIEAERFATHLRIIIKRTDMAPVWTDPLSGQSAKVFEKILQNPMLQKIEYLRDLRIWDKDGTLVWPRQRPAAGKDLAGEEKRITPKYSVEFKFERIGHHHPGRVKHKDHLAMEAFIPIWREGNDKSGKPDLVAEVYTEPRFLLEYLKGDRNLAWTYTSVIGTMVFLIMLSSVLWAARHREIAEDQAIRLEITNKLAKAVGSTLEPEEVFKKIVQEIRRAVPCERYVIASVDEKTKEYRYLYTESETDVRALTTQQATQKAENFYYRIYESRQPLNIPELKDEDLTWSAHLQEAGLRSHLAVPILQGDRCVAHLALSSTRVNAFSAEDEKFFAAISSHLGSAIRNATLHRTAQNRAARLEITSRISKTLGSTLEPKELFRIIARDIRQVVPCDRFAMASHLEGGGSHHYWHTESDVEISPRKEEEFRDISEWFLKEIYEPKKIWNIRNLQEEGLFWTNQLTKAGMQSMLLVPVLNVDRCVGHIALSSTIPSAFTVDHEEILAAIASHLGPAIQNAKLYQESEKANLAKGEFLSTMSHELRSPLNAVIGFSELLLRDSQDEMVHQLAPKIHESGKHLLSMIDELLDHDRIDQGKVTLNLEPVSINDLVAEVVDTWQTQISAGHSMTCELDSACGPVNCDLTRVIQVLNNLIDNALKYSPEGGAIHFTTHAAPDEIRVSIRDEGLGMSPGEMKLIFERFQQLESGYTRRAGGLGIGLALARKLMEMHGGRIWAESEKGKGSTFTFALPRNPSAETESPGQSDGAEEPSGDGEPWDGRTILIVDDVEHYHVFLELLMGSARRLEFAHNGLESIEAARRECPDLILMDLRMPVMDGFDAIEQLKSDPATNNIPIIAVTAQAMGEDKIRSSQAGANGFVTKPVDIKALRIEVGRVLGVRV